MKPMKQTRQGASNATLRAARERYWKQTGAEIAAGVREDTFAEPDGETKLLSPDSEEFIVSSRSGDRIGFYADISERKRLESQLLQANKLESVGRLAGGIAHDFNNLLTVVNGHAELLLNKLPQNHPLSFNASEICKAGQRAAGLTSQLLAFSRKQVLQPKILSINAIVAEMESMLPSLIGEDVQLVTTLDPHLGSVKADPTRLQQIIMNLVLNARDAISVGGVITILDRQS